MAVLADRAADGDRRAARRPAGRATRAGGRSLLVVLTVSPSDPGEGPPDGYGSTRAFYRKMGFVLARDFPGMWDTNTPVLMVRPLR
jgi:hypothetical protein